MMQENTVETNSGDETALLGDGELSSSSECDIYVSTAQFHVNN